MANIQAGNTIHIDTVGDVPGQANIKIIHAIFHSNASGDSAVFKETASGGIKIKFQNNLANDSKHFRFESAPIVFARGIYLASISSGASVTLITSQSGGGT